jgi:hypothetical protein
MEQFLESIQPAQQFGVVLTGILPSKVTNGKWQLAIGNWHGSLRAAREETTKF